MTEGTVKAIEEVIGQARSLMRDIANKEADVRRIQTAAALYLRPDDSVCVWESEGDVEGMAGARHGKIVCQADEQFSPKAVVKNALLKVLHDSIENMKTQLTNLTIPSEHC